MKTFYWYDYETFGLSPKVQRIAQFAGIRTDEIQHSGLGKNLMKEAEKISKEEFDAKKILVISAVGTREYYQKIGYSLYGPYMSKILN